MRCFSRSPLMASSVIWATGVPAAGREDGTQVWGCPQRFQALTSQGPRGQGHSWEHVNDGNDARRSGERGLCICGRWEWASASQGNSGPWVLWLHQW